MLMHCSYACARVRLRHGLTMPLSGHHHHIPSPPAPPVGLNVSHHKVRVSEDTSNRGEASPQSVTLSDHVQALPVLRNGSTTEMCNPPPQPPPRAGKPGGQRVGERVDGAFYPTWRAGSKFWTLAQNTTYYAVLAVYSSFHFAWHCLISAAPKILVFGNFAEFR